MSDRTEIGCATSGWTAGAGLPMALGTAVALLLPLLFGGGAARAEEPPEVRVSPGQVVGWQGEGTEACRRGQDRWQPLGDTCWYPVDLLAGEGVRVVERRRNGRWDSAVVRVGEYPYEVQRLEIEDESKVHLSAEDLQRVRAEQRRVAELWDRDTRRRFDLPLTPPLADLPEGGRFGARRIINGEPRSPHTGADYRAPAGTPVRAAAGGVVALAAEHFFAGKSVFLDHGDGLITMYFHLREIGVEEGQELEAGDTIGEVGSTGRSTGPHLHFGVRWRGERLDPALLLDPERAPRLER